MATANEEDLNAALNTPTGQAPAKAEPEPEPPEPEEQDTVDPPDPEPELEGDPEPEPDDKPLTRGERRFQQLANEKAQERAGRELAERQAEFYRQQAEALARQQAKPVEEELDPEERWRRDANKAISETRFMAADMADKATFLTKYSKSPEVLAMVDEVETRLASARAQGANTTRENMLTFIMGQRQLERLSKAPVVRQKAADRVNAAKGSPLGTKSNVASTGKSEPSLHERLKDVPL